MGEQIISGSGTQYPLIINPDGSLNVGISGNIIIGSVSAQVDSIYVQSGDNININKAEVYGSGTFNVAGTFDTGSESWIKGGSIILYGIGSSYITNQYLGSETYIPAGSINVMNLYAGSEVFNRVAGSIVNLPDVVISSASTIGSYTTQTVDGTVTANTGLYAGSESWVKSVPKTETYVSGLVTISGVVGVEFSNDYVNVIQSGTNWTVSGNVGVINRVAGSIVNIPSIDINNPQTIGSYTGLYLGSKSYLLAKSGTNYYELVSTPESALVTTMSGTYGQWTGVGSIYLAGGIGSVNITNTLSAIGSFTGMVNGSVAITNIGSVIQSTSPWIVAGSVALTNIGSVIQSTSPWIILGSVYQTNSTEVATGSTSYNYVKSGTVWIEEPEYRKIITSGTLPISGLVTVNNRVAGSIVDMPSVSITNPQTIGSWTGLYTGSKVWEQNIYPGSKVYQGDRFGISGIVEVSNRIAGSIVNIPPVIGSFALTNIGSVIQATSPWVISGLVNTNLYAGSHSYGYDFVDRFIQRIDYDGGNNPIYLGFAVPGTVTSSGIWQIRKLGYSGGLTTSILFGSGNTSFDKVWDNRSGTNEVYS